MPRKCHNSDVDIVGRLLIALCFLSLVACGHQGQVLPDLSVSLADLQRIATEALPLGKREQSVNARDLYSHYFLPKSGRFERADSLPTRKYAHITILGERRPYTMEIKVVVERREADGSYSPTKNDEGMERVITRRIQKMLNERREDRNIIDDFRPF